jgi:hypothetical protein
MTFPLPYLHARRPDGSTQFEWPITDYPDQQHNGAYYVRGALAWPILNEVTGIATGHAIVAAQRISTGRIILLADTGFKCVDHVLKPDGSIAFTGLAPWFNWAWSKLMCDTYYRCQDDDTHRQWLLQVIRSKMIQPTPCFPNVQIGEINAAVAILYALRDRGGLALHPESAITTQLNLWEGAGRKVMVPGVLALLCLVFGVQKWPFRPESEE